MIEKISVIGTAIEREEQGDKIFDPEEGQEPPKRQFLLTHALLVSFAMILVLVVEMACVARVSNPVFWSKTSRLTDFISS
jgi:hypothetical protein